MTRQIKNAAYVALIASALFLAAAAVSCNKSNDPNNEQYYENEFGGDEGSTADNSYDYEWNSEYSGDSTEEQIFDDGDDTQSEEPGEADEQDDAQSENSSDNADSDKACVRDCGGKNCGDDGCGGSCGECNGCANLCILGACQAEANYSYQCLAGDIYWLNSCGAIGEMKENCANGCADGRTYCDAAQVCQPGAYRCNGSTREKCDASGQAWSAVQTCECGCSESSCALGQNCPPGAVTCEAGTRYQCSPDACGWHAIEHCACGCVGSSCKALLCSPNEKRCSGGCEEECDGNGCSWLITKGCDCGCGEDGKCIPHACEPASYYCDGDYSHVCKASGCGPIQSTYCKCGCFDGRCNASCTPGAYRCNGNNREKCDSDGCGWTVAESCSCGCNQFYECIKKSCVQGEYSCDGNARMKCKTDGCGFTKVEDCACMCEEGECLSETGGGSLGEGNNCDPTIRARNGVIGSKDQVWTRIINGGPCDYDATVVVSEFTSDLKIVTWLMCDAGGVGVGGCKTGWSTVSGDPLCPNDECCYSDNMNLMEESLVTAPACPYDSHSGTLYIKVHNKTNKCTKYTLEMPRTK